jgi:MbtH protein
VGPRGTKEQCLKFTGEVWTDMRPLSLRRKMEEVERKKSEAGQVKTEPVSQS